jgi:hypothetical protein
MCHKHILCQRVLLSVVAPLSEVGGIRNGCIRSGECHRPLTSGIALFPRFLLLQAADMS